MFQIEHLPIVVNEKMVDENGEPLKEAAIFKDRLECHPSMEDKMKEAQEHIKNKTFVTE